MWRKVTKSDTMDSFDKFKRIYAIKRLKILWIIVGLICMVFLLYGVEDRTNNRSTAIDHNYGSTSRLANYESNLDDVNSIEYQPYYTQTRSTFIDESIPSADELNNTNKAVQEILFFNRVPKVGSQTFMELLIRLSYANGFRFHRDAVQRVEIIRLSAAQQNELATAISYLPPPAAYVKHVCFTNFSRYGYSNPIYVNLVRDPVERVISWFYYIRAPWYYVERKRAFPDLPLPDTEWLKKDFESCVLTGDPECVYNQGVRREGIGDHRRQTLFFCGHEPDCTPFNSQEALDKAKRNVEENYAVVGILEDLNTTFAVMEHYVPRFFKGIKNIYHASPINRVNRNAFKPHVSDYVKDLVRKNFSREMEFYEFCRNRLNKQYKALRLPTTQNGIDASGKYLL